MGRVLKAARLALALALVGGVEGQGEESLLRPGAGRRGRRPAPSRRCRGGRRRSPGAGRRPRVRDVEVAGELQAGAGEGDVCPHRCALQSRGEAGSGTGSGGRRNPPATSPNLASRPARCQGGCCLCGPVPGTRPRPRRILEPWRTVALLRRQRAGRVPALPPCRPRSAPGGPAGRRPAAPRAGPAPGGAGPARARERRLRRPAGAGTHPPGVPPGPRLARRRAATRPGRTGLPVHRRRRRPGRRRAAGPADPRSPRGCGNCCRPCPTSPRWS